MDTVLRLLSWSTRKDEVTDFMCTTVTLGGNQVQVQLEVQAPPGGVVGQLLSEFPPVGP